MIDEYEGQIEFDDVLSEIEVGVDISEGNYDILRYYRDEYKDLLTEIKRLRQALYWVSGEETRVDVGYMWETVEMILDGRIDGPYGFDDNDDWAKLLEDTLLAKRNINKDDSTNSKYPEEGEKESE